jgi:transposase-like protein
VARRRWKHGGGDRHAEQADEQVFSPTVWWWQDRRYDQGDTVGQVLHGSATTTHAIRAAIHRSQASIQALSERYSINPKTVAKWRKRTSLEDRPMGPRAPRSTVLSADEETLVVAFRRHTLLPLDDCLYALQATIPHLTRSALHRLFQRHQISRLPTAEGTKVRQRFRSYPLGYVHIDLAEVWTQAGRLYLFVAIDRVSKFAFAELHKRATPRLAADFLRRLIERVPYRIHTVLTDNGLPQKSRRQSFSDLTASQRKSVRESPSGFHHRGMTR